jgi:DtxR family Mn-dependent transcriptional regulator
MANLKLHSELSESEEMYLITIARVVEDGTSGPVPLSVIATELGVSTASANEMIRKMDEAGLVTYVPYRGAELADRGRAIARRVLRNRRLWEVFLTQNLGMGISEADALACRMEHITPSPVADRLADHLGNPTVSPQGRAIPPGQEPPPERRGVPLTDAAVGDAVEVQALECDRSTRRFLESAGIVPGTRLRLAGSIPDGQRLVEIDGEHVDLSADLAGMIIVEVGTGL